MLPREGSLLLGIGQNSHNNGAVWQWRLGIDVGRLRMFLILVLMYSLATVKA